MLPAEIVWGPIHRATLMMPSLPMADGIPSPVRKET